MEILPTYEHLKIIYGELEKALLKFEFEKKMKDRYMVFVKKASKAMIVLSQKPKKTLIYPPHFASATNTLFLHGITQKREDLPKLILKQRADLQAKKAQAAA